MSRPRPSARSAHYFQPGNLTALRELALRRTAQRVDEQMLAYMRAHAISGPWPAGERVLVCVSEHPGAPGLVRYARGSPTGCTRPGPRSMSRPRAMQRLDDAARDRIAEALRLAERLGGQTMTIPGRGIAEDVVAYAKRQQHHADRHRQIRALALVRDAAWLGGA